MFEFVKYFVNADCVDENNKVTEEAVRAVKQLSIPMGELEGDITPMCKFLATRPTQAFVIEDASIQLIQTANGFCVTFQISENRFVNAWGAVWDSKEDKVYCIGNFGTVRLLLTLLCEWLLNLSNVVLYDYYDALTFLYRYYTFRGVFGTYKIKYSVDSQYTINQCKYCTDFIDYVCKYYMQSEANKAMRATTVNYSIVERALIAKKEHILQYPGYGVCPSLHLNGYTFNATDKYIRCIDEDDFTPRFVLYKLATSTLVFVAEHCEPIQVYLSCILEDKCV